MPEQQITGFPVRAAPNLRVTKDSENFELLAVNATFDGSGASADFLPAVEIVSDSGDVVARHVTGEAVTAGDSAEVTFAPFLRGRVPQGFGSLAWLQGIGSAQFGGGTSVAAGANGLSIFDILWTNPDETIFETNATGGTPLGFRPVRNGMYGVWVASQWDVGAFDKMIGFQSPLVDGLFNGRNSNSVAVYSFFLLQGLSHATTIFLVNKNGAAIAHNVEQSYMAAVYLGAGA